VPFLQIAAGGLLVGEHDRMPGQRGGFERCSLCAAPSLNSQEREF
jgi:hypothetical protein